jgi:hypothetical protein
MIGAAIPVYPRVKRSADVNNTFDHTCEWHLSEWPELAAFGAMQPRTAAIDPLLPFVSDCFDALILSGADTSEQRVSRLLASTFVG